LASLAGSFDDGSQQTYDVDFPDVLALQGAKALLDYGDGKGVAAAGYIVGGARTALLGFPLEAAWPESVRHELVAGLVDWLAVEKEPSSCPRTHGDEPAMGAMDIGPRSDGGRVSADGAALDVVAPGVGPNQNADSGCGCRAAAGATPGSGAICLIIMLLALMGGRRGSRVDSVARSPIWP